MCGQTHTAYIVDVHGGPVFFKGGASALPSQSENTGVLLKIHQRPLTMHYSVPFRIPWLPCVAVISMYRSCTLPSVPSECTHPSDSVQPFRGSSCTLTHLCCPLNHLPLDTATWDTHGPGKLWQHGWYCILWSCLMAWDRVIAAEGLPRLATRCHVHSCGSFKSLLPGMAESTVGTVRTCPCWAGPFTEVHSDGLVP